MSLDHPPDQEVTHHGQRHGLSAVLSRTTSDGHRHPLASILSRHSDVPTLDELNIGPPPDGGTTAWLVIASTMLVQFVVVGFINANGQLQNYWHQHQLSDYSVSDIAWLGSILVFVEFALSIVAGRYFDIHGPQRLIRAGIVCGFGGVIGLAFCKEYYQFFLASLLFSFSAACIYAPSTAIGSQWFLKKRATAIATVTTGGALGGVVYPILIQRLLGLLSYRDAMITIACFNFALMTPAVFLMKARLPPHRPPPLNSMKGPWRQPQYVFLVLGAALYTMNIMSPFYHAIEYANSNHVAANLTQYSIAIAGAGSVVGRIGTGLLADVVGAWRVYGGIGLISGIVMFAFWTPPNIGTAPTVLGLVFFGIVSGAWWSLIGSATAAISPVHENGMRIGMLITCCAIPTLVGPVICGALIGANDGRWTYAGAFCGALFVVSNVVTLAPWIRCRPRKQADASTTMESAEMADAKYGPNVEAQGEVHTSM